MSFVLYCTLHICIPRLLDGVTCTAEEIPKEEEKKPPEPGLDTVLFGVWQFSAFWNFDGFRSRMATLASEKGRNEHGNDGLLVSQAAKPKPAKGRSPEAQCGNRKRYV